MDPQTITAGDSYLPGWISSLSHFGRSPGPELHFRTMRTNTNPLAMATEQEQMRNNYISVLLYPYFKLFLFINACN